MRRDIRLSRRSGFTLIELLVVISLMMFLAGLAVMFLPSATTSQREANGASQLQGFINTAKQKALRDQAPRGVRMHMPDYTTTTGNFTQPAVKANVTVTVANPNGAAGNPLGLPGQVIFIQNGGYYQVVSQAGNQYTLENLGYAQNAAPNTTVPGLSTFTPLFVTNCEFIEQPDDFTFFNNNNGAGPIVGTISVATNSTAGFPIGNTYVTLAPVPPYPAGVAFAGFMGGIPPAVVAPVAVGDYLELFGSGTVHYISSIVDDNHLYLQSPGTPFQYSNVSYYRIIRAARPTGDEAYFLPDGIVVDLTTNATFGSTLPTFNNNYTQLDVMFSPSGAVISPGVTRGSINLWVRNPDPTAAFDVFAGDPTILGVFTTSGMIGAFPPDRVKASPNYPYTLVK